MFDLVYKIPFLWKAEETIKRVKGNPPSDLVRAVEEAKKFPGCMRSERPVILH